MRKIGNFLLTILIATFILLPSVNASWTGNATGSGTTSTKGSVHCGTCYGVCYSVCNNAWFNALKMTLVYYDGSNYKTIAGPVYVGDYAGYDLNSASWKAVFSDRDFIHWAPLKNINNGQSNFASRIKSAVLNNVNSLLNLMGTSESAVINDIKNGKYPKHKRASGSSSDTGVRIIAEAFFGYARTKCSGCGGYFTNYGTIKAIGSLMSRVKKPMSNDRWLGIANKLKLEYGDIGFSKPHSSPSFSEAASSTAGWGIGIFSPWDSTNPGEAKCDPGTTKASIEKCCKEVGITDKDTSKNTTKYLTKVISKANLEKYCTTRCNPGTTAATIKNCCSTVGITNLNTTKNTTEYLTSVISKANLQKYCSNRCNPGTSRSSIQACCKEHGITVGNQSKNTLDYLTSVISKSNLEKYCPNKCNPDVDGVVTCCKLFGITPTNQTNNTTMYLTRLLTNYELTNSECNPNFLNCKYSLSQDMQDKCTTKTKGYITDENNEWKCVFYSTKASYSEVKNHFKELTGNDYCAIYCRERVDYEFPLANTTVYAGQYMVVKDSVLDPSIWPIRYTATKTCRTTKEQHSTEGYINVKQFEKDMASNEVAIKNAWDNYRILYAKQEACNNATYSGSGTHSDCVEYGTKYYTYEGVQYSYWGCTKYESRVHYNYSGGKATYDGQTYTCSYTTSPCGCYSKPNYNSQIASAKSTYDSLINKRNSMINQLNQCNYYNVPLSFEPKLTIEYEEPVYGEKFNLQKTSTSNSSYNRYYTSGNASAGSGSYQGSAPTKKMKIRNCNWNHCRDEKEITYPVTTWVEYQKKTKYEYGLNNNVYRYIAKYSSRSFHTAAEAGANYTTMPYSNFPVHVSTYPGKYDFKVTTTTYGSGNKFTKYVFSGNTFAGASYKKSGVYNCEYAVSCERFLVKKDCAEFKSRCGKQYQESGCSAELIYRTISLDTDKKGGSEFSLAFLNQSGSPRTPGYNWKVGARVDQYIVNNRGVKGYQVYKQDPMYEITLTPALMKTIREYNKKMNNVKVTVYEGTGVPTTGVAGYTSQDGLVCKNNGETCTSKIIRTWGVKGCAIKTGKAGYSKCKGVTAW